MRVEIWSDIVCPWCYLGEHRFGKALDAFPHNDQVEVVHRSFQLDPAAPADDPPLAVDMLRSRYGMSAEQVRETMTRIEGLAAADGLEYHLAGTRSGNTFDAHRLVHFAADRGLQAELRTRLYRAYFTEGRSVFTHDALITLAVEVGLDHDEVSRVLGDGSYADAVRADAREAAALGATGVPFFVIDRRYGISGAQSVEVFGRAIVRAWTDTRQDITAAVPPPSAGGARAGDTCVR